ncbi:hypothetical protein [Chelativorans sp. AA-79]|uniref:hypothetical protein n=1 Tax=Chelativorans sp. AA-79 TaxID=3028735 RepID=UPI0023F6E42E|nr:hypothetical protein [Chelativorans sp. AA-79]WEX09640.1 hypothetical protein PVE73_01320 [Chelativorans sp. AA-79]
MSNHDLLIDLAMQTPPFVLVARNPLPTSIEVRTTTAVRFDTVDAAASWVSRAERAARNLYVVRNPCVDGRLYRRRSDGVRISAARWGNPPLIEDIASIEWLVIDLDPVSADGDRAVDHANELLDRLPVALHYRMFSGRGVQAALRLAEPAHSDNEKRFRAALELADRVNTWLRNEADPSLVTVDDVSNINRFSRLCGTINQKTGLRATWIMPPCPDAVVVSPETALRHITPTRARHWQRVAIADGVDPYVAEAVREIGRQPNEAELDLLRQIGAHDRNPSPPLSEEFQHRAASGEDWAGNINPDRSARIISFASAALKAGEPISAIVAALLDPENETLNEHWLKPKSGRPNPRRVAFRAIAKAIMALGLERSEVEAGHEDF